jgi:predicted RNA-binding Zn-ribbon protein involved in translation (DUF1610 family)
MKRYIARHRVKRPCPVCGAVGYVDRTASGKRLAVLDATCSECGWHYSARSYSARSEPAAALLAENARWKCGICGRDQVARNTPRNVCELCEARELCEACK